MDEYERFAFDAQHAVDERRWKPIMQRENVTVFAERREKEILAGADGPDVPRNAVVARGRGVVIRSTADSDSDSGRRSSGRDGGGRCATCGKTPSALQAMTSKARSTCKICLETVCSACRLRRKLSFFTREQRLVQTELAFCPRCVAHAAELDAGTIATDELVAAHPFSWKEAYASSSSSSDPLSPTGTESSIQVASHFGG
ncbi:hypothetical protein PybrP1_012225 [[Pythium] brassicae (nom. inval.)]|nr:hypothetical protein PybrP1_012225 [[Pythium] brassicae (nom. inval.)]